MDFKKLLKPYEEGGITSSPVKRTMGTIVDYLVNKKGYPLDVVGGAIFMVFFWLDAGNEFKGNGKYGSKGKELVTSIRMKCDELLQRRLQGEAYGAFVEIYGAALKEQAKQQYAYSWKRDFVKWWYGRDVIT